VEDFGATPDCFGQRLGANRHDHELLEVDLIVGMLTAVDDVHHRHRQQLRGNAADIAVERQSARVGRRLRGSEADAQDRIGAEPAFVLRSVERDQGRVDFRLVLRFHADDRAGDVAAHGLDRLRHALAHVAGLVAVALFDSLVRAGRRPGRHRRAAHAAVLQQNLHFHRRIAAGIEDLAGVDVDDGGHGKPFRMRMVRCGTGSIRALWRGQLSFPDTERKPSEMCLRSQSSPLFKLYGGHPHAPA
jgi:hypothetical protein